MVQIRLNTPPMVFAGALGSPGPWAEAKSGRTTLATVVTQESFKILFIVCLFFLNSTFSNKFSISHAEYKGNYGLTMLLIIPTTPFARSITIKPTAA